jgi:hypothetical protein
VKKLLFSLFALVAFLAGQAQVSAQTMKPVVVVSLAGYDELMSDVDFLGQITGIPMLSAQMAEEGLKQITQGQGLKGLDKKKPWGGVLLSDGGFNFKFLVFVPVSDVKGLVEVFAGPPFGFSAKDVGDGVVEVQGPVPQPGFAKTQGGYTFFAQEAAHLADLPKDPEALLSGLNKEYDFAVRAFVQNVPQAFRDQILGGLKMGMQFSLQQPNPGEDPQAFALRKQLVEQQLTQLETLFKELDTFTIGAKIDGAAKTANLDIGVTVAAGSEMAKQLAKIGEVQTDHAGFLLPDAAVNMTAVGVVSPQEIEQANTMIKSLGEQAKNEIDKDVSSFKNPKTRETAKEILTDVIGVVTKTVATGKIDFGATVLLAPESATVVAGGSVADGATFESALKKFVQMITEEAKEHGEQLPEIKLNAGKLDSITLHTMSIPIPDADVQKAFGETAELVVGIGAKSVHVAFGRNATEALKKVVDHSTANAAKTVPPFQMIASLTPILTFANSMEPNPDVAGVVQTLSATPGKDHVSLVAEIEKNGILYRLKAEEGVLRAIGAGVRTAIPVGAGF